MSSTLEELANERAAVREAIRRLRLSPVLFELGARAHPPRSLYRSYLEQSHVFIGLYWERYGWVAPGMEVSGLEDEYLLGTAKPILVYVKRPAPGREERLVGLLDRIRSDDAVSYRAFTNADAGDVPTELYEGTFDGFNSLISPWHAWLDTRTYGRHVDVIEAFGATTIASAHGPLLTGSFIPEAFDRLRALAGRPVIDPPDQSLLDEMLAGVMAASGTLSTSSQ